ncbi:MAG: LysR family transcriptional regulator [Christensenellaceae bacterium]|jgi:DNA-binding transcriptional LysR family regulator|nr:LysR family transcriptional regulator [Christensenellaceae bacterium]
MTLQQLKYFVEVANSGSIRTAAKLLYMSQPSLSRAIKELEHELQISLFARTMAGVFLTPEGVEFSGYARQVLEQAKLLEHRYFHNKPSKSLCSISTQHYAFAVNAFVNMVKQTDSEEYNFTLRETRTNEIIEDVKTLRSEIGILFKNPFNEKVINKLLHESDVIFHHLFTAKPHIFVSSSNPLASKNNVDLADLTDYPCITFEQGINNSFYFSEEILSIMTHKKNISVSDRATVFNLLIGLNAYTISTGIVSSDLNGDNIKAVPLNVDDYMKVGYILKSGIMPNKQVRMFIDELKKVASQVSTSNLSTI